MSSKKNIMSKTETLLQSLCDKIDALIAIEQKILDVENEQYLLSTGQKRLTTATVTTPVTAIVEVNK